MSLRSFLIGIGSVLDLFPTTPDRDLPKTDAEAFQRDWEALMDDWQKCSHGQFDHPHCPSQPSTKSDAAKGGGA